MLKMGNHQGPPIEQWELCSVSRGSLVGRGVWERMDTCVCVAASFCCPPEIITISLIGCTPVGFPGGTRGQYRRLKRRSFYCEDPWSRARYPTPVFFSGESRGNMILAGYIVHIVLKSQT